MILLRRLSVFLLFILFTALISLHTRFLVLGIIAILLSNEEIIKEKAKAQKRWMFLVIIVGYVILFPKRSFDKDDTFQSVYFDTSGETVSMPWIPYLANVISEEDGQSVVTFVMKAIPESGVKLLIQMAGMGYHSAFQDIVTYSKETSLSDNILFSGLTANTLLPSNLYFQSLQTVGIYKDLSHYFVHIPEGKKLEDCEVTVFCHGYLGNWLLYPKLYAEYSDHIVISVETKDLNGIFTYHTMKHIYDKVLPHAYERIGIPKNTKAHLVGLSNGGSAVNTALKTFPTHYKSYSVLSAGLHVTPTHRQKVKLIYGEKDRSGGVNASIPKRSFQHNIIKGGNHVVLISDSKKVFSILQQ